MKSWQNRCEIMETFKEVGGKKRGSLHLNDVATWCITDFKADVGQRKMEAGVCKKKPPPFPSPGFKSNKSRHYLIMRNKDQTETLKLSVWFLLCFVLFNKDFDLDFHEPWTSTTTRHGCGSNYDSDLKLLGWPQRFDFNAHVHINWMLRTVKYCGATHTHTRDISATRQMIVSPVEHIPDPD